MSYQSAVGAEEGVQAVGPFLKVLVEFPLVVHRKGGLFTT
jgi:hypothetical protein